MHRSFSRTIVSRRVAAAIASLAASPHGRVLYIGAKYRSGAD